MANGLPYPGDTPTERPRRRTTLTQAEVEDILRKAGWPEDKIPVMSAIAMAESSGRIKPPRFHGLPGQRLPEESVGLFQINMHPSLKRKYDADRLESDPVYNAKAALEIYKGGHKSGQPLNHWGTFSNKKYKKWYTGAPLDPASFDIVGAENDEPVATVTMQGQSNIPAFNYDPARVAAWNKQFPAHPIKSPRLGQIAQKETANMLAGLMQPTADANGVPSYMGGQQQPGQQLGPMPQPHPLLGAAGQQLGNAPPQLGAAPPQLGAAPPQLGAAPVGPPVPTDPTAQRPRVVAEETPFQPRQIAPGERYFDFEKTGELPGGQGKYQGLINGQHYAVTPDNEQIRLNEQTGRWDRVDPHPQKLKFNDGDYIRKSDDIYTGPDGEDYKVTQGANGFTRGAPISPTPKKIQLQGGKTIQRAAEPEPGKPVRYTDEKGKGYIVDPTKPTGQQIMSEEGLIDEKKFKESKAYPEYKQFLTYAEPGSPESIEGSKESFIAFNDAMKAAGASKDAYMPEAVGKDTELAAQEGQLAPGAEQALPTAERIPPRYTTGEADKPQNLADTRTEYRVPISNLPVEQRRAIAEEAAVAQTAAEQGMSPEEQAKLLEIVRSQDYKWSEEALDPNVREAIVSIARGDIAKVIGEDRVKQAYAAETEPIRQDMQEQLNDPNRIVGEFGGIPTTANEARMFKDLMGMPRTEQEAYHRLYKEFQAAPIQDANNIMSESALSQGNFLVSPTLWKKVIGGLLSGPFSAPMQLYDAMTLSPEDFRKMQAEDVRQNLKTAVGAAGSAKELYRMREQMRGTPFADPARFSMKFIKGMVADNMAPMLKAAGIAEAALLRYVGVPGSGAYGVRAPISGTDTTPFKVGGAMEKTFEAGLTPYEDPEAGSVRTLIGESAAPLGQVAGQIMMTAGMLGMARMFAPGLLTKTGQLGMQGFIESTVPKGLQQTFRQLGATPNVAAIERLSAGFGGLTGIAQVGSEAYTTSKKHGATEDQAMLVALLTFPLGALEGMSDALVMSRLNKLKSLDKATNGAFSARLKNIFTGFIENGSTEMGEEIIQNLGTDVLQQIVHRHKERDLRAFIKDLDTSFKQSLTAFIAGGVPGIFAAGTQGIEQGPPGGGRPRTRTITLQPVGQQPPPPGAGAAPVADPSRAGQEPPPGGATGMLGVLDAAERRRAEAQPAPQPATVLTADTEAADAQAAAVAAAAEQIPTQDEYVDQKMQEALARNDKTFSTQAAREEYQQLYLQQEAGPPAMPKAQPVEGVEFTAPEDLTVENPHAPEFAIHDQQGNVIKEGLTYPQARAEADKHSRTLSAEDTVSVQKMTGAKAEDGLYKTTGKVMKSSDGTPMKTVTLFAGEKVPVQQPVANTVSALDSAGMRHSSSGFQNGRWQVQTTKPSAEDRRGVERIAKSLGMEVEDQGDLMTVFLPKADQADRRQATRAFNKFATKFLESDIGVKPAPSAELKAGDKITTDMAHEGEILQVTQDAKGQPLYIYRDEGGQEKQIGPEEIRTVNGKPAPPQAAAPQGSGLNPVAISMAKRRTEEGHEVEDIAELFGVEPEVIEAIPELPEVGNFGKLKAGMMDHFLEPENAQDLADVAAAMLDGNPLAVEWALEGNVKQKRAVVGAIMDAIAAQTGESGVVRSSHMTDEEWDTAIIRLMDVVPDSVIDAMVVAAVTTSNWHKNMLAFINDPFLRPVVDAVIALGKKTYQSLNKKGDERRLALKILKIGKKYGKQKDIGKLKTGLRSDIIKRVFNRLISGELPSDAVRRSSERAEETFEKRSKKLKGKPEPPQASAPGAPDDFKWEPIIPGEEESDLADVAPAGEDPQQALLNALPILDTKGLQQARQDAEGELKGIFAELQKVQEERIAQRQREFAEPPNMDLLTQTVLNTATQTETGTDLELSTSTDQMSLLRQVGKDMYEGDLFDTVVKEAMQNSLDAVTDAKEFGQIEDPRITLHWDPDTRELTITDNGLGMDLNTILTAYLRLGGSHKPGKVSIGGKGMAKALLLYGPSSVKVSTVKDGVEINFLVTPENADPKMKIAAKERPTNKPNGTTQVFKIPETVDFDGLSKEISAPYSSDGLARTSFFRQPLIKDVEIAIEKKKNDYNSGHFDENEDWVYDKITEEEVLPVGKHFPVDDYEKTSAETSWGDMDIYVSKVKKAHPWEVKQVVLANGAYQFDEEFKVDKNSKFLYDVIIDVHPHADATSPSYPFNIRREGWQHTVEEDVAALKSYMANKGKMEIIQNQIDKFSKIKQLPRLTGNETDEEFKQKVAAAQASINKSTAEQQAAQAAVMAATAPVRNVVIKGGKVSAKNKLERSFTPEVEIQDPRDLIADLGLKPGQPVFHNNTNRNWEEEIGNVEGPAMRPEAVTAFFTEMSNAVQGVLETIAAMAPPDPVTGETNGLLSSLEDVPKGIQDFYSGVSIDMEYRGVWIGTPFKGMFVNPFSVQPSANRLGTVEAAAISMYLTTVHEIGHLDGSDHGAQFVNRLQEGLLVLMATDQQGKILQQYADILSKYEPVWRALKTIYEHPDTQNIGESIGRDADAPTDAGTDAAIADERGAYEGVEPGGERPGSSPSLPDSAGRAGEVSKPGGIRGRISAAFDGIVKRLDAARAKWNAINNPAGARKRRDKRRNDQIDWQGNREARFEEGSKESLFEGSTLPAETERGYQGLSEGVSPDYTPSKIEGPQMSAPMQAAPPPSGMLPHHNMFNQPGLKSNRTYAWRSMGEGEFRSLMNGQMTYSGDKAATKGNFLAATPESAGQFGGKGRFLVEFGNVRIAGNEGLEPGSTATADNVSRVWKYDTKTGEWADYEFSRPEATPEIDTGEDLYGGDTAAQVRSVARDGIFSNLQTMFENRQPREKIAHLERIQAAMSRVMDKVYESVTGVDHPKTESARERAMELILQIQDDIHEALTSPDPEDLDIFYRHAIEDMQRAIEELDKPIVRPGDMPQDVSDIHYAGVKEAHHGSPVVFAAEVLVKTPDGKLIYIEGKPGELPKVPPGHRAIRSYPHGRHRLDKILSGSGGITMGVGHYAADLYEVAKFYRPSEKEVTWKGEKVGNSRYGVRVDELTDNSPQMRAAHTLAFDMSDGMAFEQAQEDAIGMYEALVQREPDEASFKAELAAVKELKAEDFEVKRLGAMYQVELMPKADEWLLYDVPFSKQSKKVQNAIKLMLRHLSLDYNALFGATLGTQETTPLDRRRYKGMDIANVLEQFSNPNFGRVIADPAGDMTGGDFYWDLAGKLGTTELEGGTKASEMLYAYGIRGNKYYDNTSRDHKTREQLEEEIEIEKSEARQWDMQAKDYQDTLEEMRAENPQGVFRAQEQAIEDAQWSAQAHRNNIDHLEQQLKNVDKPPTYNYVVFMDKDIKITDVQRSTISAEQHAALSAFTSTPTPALAREHGAELVDGNLHVARQGTEIIRRLFGDAFLDSGKVYDVFAAVFLHAEQINAVGIELDKLIKSEMDAGHGQVAAALKELQALFQEASKSGTLIIATKMGERFAEEMKNALIEEYAHRADYLVRQGKPQDGSTFKSVDGYDEATKELRKNRAYRHQTAAYIHNEIIAKIFRPDALAELGITEAQRQAIEDRYVNQLVMDGVTGQDIINAFEGVNSIYAKNFAQRAQTLEAEERSLTPPGIPTQTTDEANKGSAEAGSRQSRIGPDTEDPTQNEPLSDPEWAGGTVTHTPTEEEMVQDFLDWQSFLNNQSPLMAGESTNYKDQFSYKGMKLSDGFAPDMTEAEKAAVREVASSAHTMATDIETAIAQSQAYTTKELAKLLAQRRLMKNPALENKLTDQIAEERETLDALNALDPADFAQDAETGISKIEGPAMSAPAPPEDLTSAPTEAEARPSHIKSLLDEMMVKHAPKFIKEGKRESGTEFFANGFRAGLLAATTGVLTNIVGNPAHATTQQFVHELSFIFELMGRTASGRDTQYTTTRRPGDIMAGFKALVQHGVFGEWNVKPEESQDPERRGAIAALRYGVSHEEAQRLDLEYEDVEGAENAGEGYIAPGEQFLRNVPTAAKPMYILIRILNESIKRSYVAIDRPFSAFGEGAEMPAQARRIAKDMKKKGETDNWKRTMKELIAEPTQEMIELARAEGRMVTFQNPNLFTEGFEQGRRYLLTQGLPTRTNPTPGEVKRAKLAGKALYLGGVSVAPFMRTTSNVGIKAAEHDPILGSLIAVHKMNHIGRSALRIHDMELLEQEWENQNKALKGVRSKENSAHTKVYNQEIKKLDEQLDAAQKQMESINLQIENGAASDTVKLKAQRENREKFEALKDKIQAEKDRFTAEKEAVLADITEIREVENEDIAERRQEQRDLRDKFHTAREYKEAYEVMGRVGLGAMFGIPLFSGMLAGLGIAIAGSLDYDDEKEKWEAMRKAGIGEDTIKTFDYWWPARMHPMTKMATIWATGFEQWERPGTGFETAGRVAAGVGWRGILSLNPLTDPTFREEGLFSTENAGRTAMQYMPIVNLGIWRQLGEVLDEKGRSTRRQGFTGPLRKQIPPGLLPAIGIEGFGRESLPESKHPLGIRGDEIRRALRLLEPSGGSFQVPGKSIPKSKKKKPAKN